MYPGWSARDNYAQNKKKKRKKLQDMKTVGGQAPNGTLNPPPSIKVTSCSPPGLSPKKPRPPRYDQQDLWCKPCK